jgi:hypothetical protein
MLFLTIEVLPKLGLHKSRETAPAQPVDAIPSRLNCSLQGSCFPTENRGQTGRVTEFILTYDGKPSYT